MTDWPARFRGMARDMRAQGAGLFAAGWVERAEYCERNAVMAEQFAAMEERRTCADSQTDLFGEVA